MAPSNLHSEPERRPAEVLPPPPVPPVPPIVGGVETPSAGSPFAVQPPSSVVPPGPIPATGSTNQTTSSPEQNESAAEADRGDVAATVIENSPAWLISMAFHMVMMIVMGMMVYVNMPQKSIQLNAETVYAEKLGDQLLFDAPGLPDVKTTATDVVIAPDQLPPVDNPLAAPANLTDIRPNATTAVSDIQAPQIGMALSGRQEGSSRKKGLLGRYGGNALTEAAVLKGLEWLARQQQRDGSWSLSGPYSAGVPKSFDNEASATAMALLAFQGAGNTHMEGKFKNNVARGWKWLLKQQDAEGCFFHSGGFNHRFYTQGQCGIAICELYGMSKDTMYREPAQRAIDYCLRSQSQEGGWRYAPNADSDVSVTGWVVMALQSARMAGLTVPYENLQNVERFLNSVAQHDGSRYPYQRGGDVRPSMTAEALLMREYLGWPRNDSRLMAGMDWITSPENLIDYKNNHNVYYWYYATQAAHHLEGNYWKRWNAVMRQVVPEHQVPRGKEMGSWDPNHPTPDQWANHGGRLYVTCLSIYMLEVYYRHLPIYASVYTFGDSDAPKPADPGKKGDSHQN